MNEELREITETNMQERILDSLVARVDEVVNSGYIAQQLIDRLKAGKIYESSKTKTTINNFFNSEHILQFHELALKEVASQVRRKVEAEIICTVSIKSERFLACIISNEKTAKNVIRKQRV